MCNWIIHDASWQMAPAFVNSTRHNNFQRATGSSHTQDGIWFHYFLPLCLDDPAKAGFTRHHNPTSPPHGKAKSEDVARREKGERQDGTQVGAFSHLES